jgi:4-hydroxybenzoate polyprenyltransferase
MGISYYSRRLNILSLLNRMFTFLSVSSLFIGGTGFFKTYIGFILLGEVPELIICFIVFLVSFSVYSLDKITDIDKDVVNVPQRRSFIHGRRGLILSSSLAAYGLAILLTLLTTPKAVPIVLVPIIANAFYGMKLLPGVPRLKEITMMKNVVVALTWALITTMMPAIATGHPAGFDVVIVGYFMFVKTFVDTILYDVRDVEGDRLNGIGTVPVILGLRKTRALLVAVNITLICMLPFMYGDVITLVSILIVYGLAYTLYLMKKRDPLILDFLVEGEWMLATLFFLFYF